jgi:threonine/homoserine/homoserine lactone efflux protein
MLGTHDLLTFILAGLLLNITPGADTLYIVGRSTCRGLRSGVVAALGIGAGCIVHIVAAAIGLSAILATSSTAFTLVKYVGAAYLAYLGLSMLVSPGEEKEVHLQAPMVSLSKVFWQGFLTNVLNPKVALFFLAFLPQFIVPEAQAKWISMLFLGFLFNFNGTLWNLFVAWSSARMSTKVKMSSRLGGWLKRICGGIFIYFGIRLVLSGNE